MPLEPNSQCLAKLLQSRNPRRPRQARAPVVAGTHGIGQLLGKRGIDLAVTRYAR